MARRSLMVVAVLALALGSPALPVGSSTGAGAGVDAVHPAVAIVASRVPSAAVRDLARSGEDGGGAMAVTDVQSASVIAVETTADGGAGSLREAIETRATSEGGDTVVLEPGATYVLTCPEGRLEHGDTPLEIEGNGATITMAAACEQGILLNGTGALVIRDVQFTGLDLTPTAGLTAIVETGGPFALIGGRVADNTIDTGPHALNGFFFKTADGAGDVVVEGTVFDDNRRDVGNDCGLFCVVGNLELRGIVITNTAVVDAKSACGAIVCVSGNVELVDSRIADTNHVAPSHCGGIACLDGELALTRTVIARTSSTMTGSGGICGGILCTSGGIVLTDSSVTDTSASDVDSRVCGGGFVCGDGDVELVRSTVAGARVRLSDGSDDNRCGSMTCIDGAMSIVNSTVADNVTTGGEALSAAFTGDGPIELVYATFVGNSGSGIPALAPYRGESVGLSTFSSVLSRSGSGGTCGLDVDVTSNGYNFADDLSCGLTGAGDRQAVGADPGLHPLADDGGPGPTMMPATGSPLIDAVSAAECRTGGAAGITTDERGAPRPSSSSPSCDIGAVEVQPIRIEPTFTG